MRHDEFISKYVGQKLDYDWVYNFQCTDLAKAYADYVLWVKVDSFWGSAWNGYLNEKNTFPIDKWETGTWSPQQGDIIFFPRTSGNPYGHVAVAHNSSEMIEQNGGTGGGSWQWTDAIRIVPIRKDLAWFWRFKGIQVPEAEKNSMWGVYLQENGEEYKKPLGTRDLCIQNPDDYISCSDKDFRIKTLIWLERAYKK